VVRVVVLELRDGKEGEGRAREVGKAEERWKEEKE
jgi:hypothetical protein